MIGASSRYIEIIAYNDSIYFKKPKKPGELRITAIDNAHKLTQNNHKNANAR
jgi:hypothetical protein